MMKNARKRVSLRCTIWFAVMVFCGLLFEANGQQKLHNQLLSENLQAIRSFYDISATIQVQNASLPEIFEYLEKQMGLRFLYDQEVIKNSGHRLNLDYEKATVADVLKEVSSLTGLTFRQINGMISVGVKKLREPAPPVDIEFFEDVSGRVLDAQTGEPLPGVNVVVRGTSTGTATDADGSFTVNVESLDETLVFTYVGYERLEIAIDGRTEINVELSPQAVTGDELVVVGYGVQRKSEITGSVGIVTADEMKPNSFNALQGLRGKVAGVNIFTNSGAPSGSNRVVIRGTGSINASTDPLYVVDGVAMGDGINFLNPNDIESIEVLKDASATAIYGARGSNGVILITTSRGGAGERLTVGYDTNISLGRMRGKMDAMNAEEFMQVQRIALQNVPVFNPGVDEAPVHQYWLDPDLFDGDGNPLYDTDWQDAATRTAFSHDHNLTIRGGIENSSLGAVLNYTDREGILLN